MPSAFITDPYFSVESLKSSLTLSGTTFADYDLPRSVAAACSAVNHVTNRRFDRDPTFEQVRYYRPKSATEIWIDDCVEITELLTDQNGNFEYEKEWEDNMWTTWPPNARVDGEPITLIELNTFRATIGFPFWNPRSVKITGKWGWADPDGDYYVPQNVQDAARLIASRLLNRFRSPQGVIPMGMDAGAVYIAKNDPDVQGLLRDFCREKVR